VADDDGSLHFFMFFEGFGSEGGGFNVTTAWSLLCVEYILGGDGPTDVGMRDAECEGPALEGRHDPVEVNLE
jgi:hypothetical protein